MSAVDSSAALFELVSVSDSETQRVSAVDGSGVEITGAFLIEQRDLDRWVAKREAKSA